MEFKTFIALLISFLLISTAFSQDKKQESENNKKDEWKYIGSTVFDSPESINVNSYFNENKIEKDGQIVKFQLKETPNKPIPFFKKVYALMYDYNPDKYADFTYLITFFEGNCRERTLRIYRQEIWGTKNTEEPIHIFRLEREFEKVRSGSSKEDDLLKACRKK